MEYCELAAAMGFPERYHSLTLTLLAAPETPEVFDLDQLNSTMLSISVSLPTFPISRTR